ncbi:centromere protein U [Lepus europaeus]|uniref:centromere protein U n=1 Tax=Lepus europaeus TaxID=9983 RepID=UPI002B4784DD|nr:centromere protein U [Lepus europaeus]
MAPPGRVRSRRRAGAVYSQNALRGTHPMKEKAGQKHKPADVFEFPDNSEISSNGSENKKDDDPYETFDPPLHSTAIYADEEELSQHCGSSVPSTPAGKATQESLSTSANEASENASVRLRAKKPGRRCKPLSDGSESSGESEIRRKVQSPERIGVPRCDAVPAGVPSGLPERRARSERPEAGGSRGGGAPADGGTPAVKTQKKETVSHGKRKKTRNAAGDSDISDSVHIWCLEGKKNSDIMELDIVLSAFEKAIQEHKERIESEICKEAINKFYCNIKEELIKMLKEAQMLKNLKRKNTKVIANIKKKRQRLIEVQDELLRLEPQLKQLQTKYEELQERKSSLRMAADFLSNLKQLYHKYSDLQEKEPGTKETYDSSSLPALLFKARTFLGAENNLQTINHQLENLLDQD